MRRMLFLSLILLVSLGSVSIAVVRRVPGEYPSIQRAINDCNDGDTVIVNPGIYYETINFSGKNIVLTSTDPNDPKVVGYTIINADGDGTVVTFENRETSNAVLTGFTITGGFGTLSEWSDEYYKQFYGAGIYCAGGASPTITRNVITNNHGPFSDQQVGDRWVSTYSDGGGIYCSGGATITHNVIYNNSAFSGGGIAANYSSVANNIIYRNSAYWGGGVYTYGGSLVNNTIVNNDCSKDPQYGRGGNVYAYVSYYDNLVVANNNICGATSGGGLYYTMKPRSDVIRFNNVWSNAPANYGFEDMRTYDAIYGEQADWTGRFGNISADPLFVDPWGNDFHLQPISPCVSAGDPNAAPGQTATDMDGDPRLFAMRVDIGADEHIGYVKPLASAGVDQHVLAPEPVTLDGSGSYFSDPNGPKTYEWSQTQGPAIELSDATAKGASFTPSAEGWYVFELVVGDGQHTSGPDRVLVVVGNEQPVADAGRDQLWPVMDWVFLDGSKSSDADPPDELTYMWTQIEGPNVVLEAANTATPYFQCSGEGIYVFELVVNDAFVGSEPDTVKLEASAWTLGAELLEVTDYEQGDFYHPDIAGTTVVSAGGEYDAGLWAIHCMDTQSGKTETFDIGAVDSTPKIDGNRIVWAAGSTTGRICTSVVLGNRITGQASFLRTASATESYGYPAISGNKVVWAHHRGVNTQNTDRYVETPYDIGGVDITNAGNPVYFTIAEQVGRGEPYPYSVNYRYANEELVDICGEIVVWEGDGDIFGADVSDLDNIKVFPICTAPERQYDPAVSGHIVVWTDERDDVGDIYGADISDPNNIREFEVWVGPGWQLQPDIDGPLIVYLDGDDYYGDIRTCCLSREYGVTHFPLGTSGAYYYYGSGPQIDGSTIVWQYSSQIRMVSFDFAYSVTEGPIQNLGTGKRYDYIQHAIDAVGAVEPAQPGGLRRASEPTVEGDVIVVEPGIYRDKVRFKGKNLLVTSTDPEDPAVRAATILAGPGQRVTFADHETADSVLTGFTIANGSYGVFSGDSTPTVSNCTITNNVSAGVKSWNGANPVFSRCEITGNGLGAAMWARLDNRFARRNLGMFRNCLIAGSRGAGILGGNLILENCTVADNLGLGVDCSLAAITNSILYFNNEGAENLKVNDAKSSVTYTDIQGGWTGEGNIDADPLFIARGEWLAPGTAAEATTTGSRPLPVASFASGPGSNWVTGDYHLKSGGWSWDALQKAWTWDNVTSPCIDAGDPTVSICEEQPCEADGPFGERSPVNARINMGAYGGTPEASLAPRAETP